MKFFLFSVLALFLSGCLTSTSENKEASKPFSPVHVFPWPVVTDAPKQLVNATPPKHRLLTTYGHNFKPRFSIDGKKIYFLKSSHPRHEHSEAYVLTLGERSPQAQKRLTHGSHPIGKVVPHRLSQTLFLTRATDELTERPELFIDQVHEKHQSTSLHAKNQSIDSPHLLHSENWQNFLFFPPYEIYQISTQLDELPTLRLTKSNDFDGDLTLHPQGKEIIFTSYREDSPNLYSMSVPAKIKRRRNRTSFKTKSYLSDADDSFLGQARYNSQGSSLVWVESQKAGVSKIKIKDLKTQAISELKIPPGWHWSPTWHPGGEWLLFSSNHSVKEEFALFLSRKDGSCLTQVTQGSPFDLYADFHPNGNQIVFSHWQDGRFQLALKDFTLPTTCETP